MPEHNSLFQVFWTLGCVLLILLAAYFFTKYVVGRSQLWPGGGKNLPVRILFRLPLTRDSQLLLVQLGEKNLLIGVSAGGVSLLCELTGEEVRKFLEGQESAASGGTEFGQVMQNMLKRGKKG